MRRRVRSRLIPWWIALPLACSPAPDGTSPGAPAEAERRWEAAALQDYRFDFQQQCFCVPEQAQPVTIEVRGGRVTRVVSRTTGQDITGAEGLYWRTVPELFRVIEGARRDGVTPLEVRYDPELGYPTSIEAGSLAADAGAVYTVSNLQPLE